jgi:hypothetical protein
MHILYSGHAAYVFNVTFQPIEEALSWSPGGIIESYPIRDQDLNEYSPEELSRLPQASHLKPGEGWNEDRFYDTKEAVVTEGLRLQKEARLQAGVRDCSRFIPGVSLSHIATVRVGIKRGTIVSVLWPNQDWCPRGATPGTGVAPKAVAGALSSFLDRAVAGAPPGPPRVPTGAGGLGTPPPRSAGGGSASGGAEGADRGRGAATDMRAEPPKVGRGEFQSPGGGRNLYGEFRTTPLSTIREGAEDQTDGRTDPPRIGGTEDYPTRYRDPNRPRSPLRAGRPDRPPTTQVELERSVAALKEEMTVMRNEVENARSRRNPEAAKEGRDRHNALLAATNRTPHGTTVYQREDKPVPIWSGKDSVAVPDRALWFQRAVVKAQRQGIPLLDYLQDVTIGNAKIWVENLLHTHTEHCLQVSLQGSGIMTQNETGGWSRSGKPVTLVEPVTDEYVVADFTRHFMTNVQNRADQARMALFKGTACVQGATDSVGDYLVAFQAACWTAKFDRKVDQFHTITLINDGLKPELKKLGYWDKNARGVFSTEERYVEFLLSEECKTAQMALTAGTSQDKFNLPAKPFFIPHAPRVNLVAEDTPGEEDWQQEEGEEMEEAEEDELDINVHGVVCGVRQGKSKPRQGSKPGGGFRQGKPSGSHSPADAMMVVPGPNGESQSMPVRDFALNFAFPTPTDVWPEGFTFSPAMSALNPPLGLADRVLKTVTIMNPNISQYRVFNTLARVAKQSSTWRWCIIHSSTAHATRDCPCLQHLCPRTKTGGRG